MLVQPLLQHNQSEQQQPDPVDNVAGNSPQRLRVANDSAKLPGERRHRKKRLSRCLRRWFFPVIVGAVALTCIALGAACRLRPVHWFKSCPAVFIPLGSVVIPFAYLLLAVYLSQPSKRDLQQQSFYSTALLEELLSRRGPSSTTMYRAVNCDLETRPSMPLLVFLSDVGGTSRAWDGALDIAARQGVCAMAVQLPGSGSLRAVSFSFSRCARTVLAVLEQEFPAIGSSASASSEVTDFRSCRRGSGGRRPHSHTDNHNQPSGHVATQRQQQQQQQQREDMTWRPRVILVAHGLACRVAMYLTGQHRLGQVQVVSVVLQGTPVSLVPRPLRPMERISFGAMRLPWVAEVVRRRDQKRTRHARAAHFSDMGPRPHDAENDITQTPGCSSTSAVRSLGATRLASGPSATDDCLPLSLFNPRAKADWALEVNVHWPSMLAAMRAFKGNGLVSCNDSKALDTLRQVWGFSARAEPWATVSSDAPGIQTKLSIGSNSSHKNRKWSWGHAASALATGEEVDGLTWGAMAFVKNELPACPSVPATQE